ncbi:MAG: HEAT repeat domain-containing protein [Solirubrobacteraceae bacterium]|jgi:HEAT repeat protein
MGLVRRAAEPPAEAERRAAPRDRAGLIAALDHSSPDVRRRAALDLAGDGAAAAPLAACIAREPDQAVREAALSTLAGIGGAAVVDALVPYLRCEDAAIRNAVVECLGEIPACADAVPRLLADPDADVRVLTVMVLASLRDPRVPGWLLDAVASDPDPNVCGAAIGELTEVGDETAWAVIEAAAARFPGDPFVAFAARTFAARIVDGAR